MHLSFKSLCNKEHKGVIYKTSSSNSSQALIPLDECFGKNYSSFPDFTRNYERTSGIFVSCQKDNFSIFDPNILSVAKWPAVSADKESCPGQKNILMSYDTCILLLQVCVLDFRRKLGR